MKFTDELEKKVRTAATAAVHPQIQALLWFHWSGWETSTRPLANASEYLAGWVENRLGRVEFCIGYIKDYPVRPSAKKF